MISTLKEQYKQAQIDNPKMRIRDIAKLLNTSEAQLVATGVGSTAVQLVNQPKEILADVIKLGKVMALTRNDAAVHERKGIYDNFSVEGSVGLFVNQDIDLRLFMMHWASVFAVDEHDRKSIQFFDKSGAAVHKIYMTEHSDLTAYDELVNKFKAENQSSDLVVEAYKVAPAELPDNAIDVASFHQDWMNLKDTHDFYGMLMKYKVTRTQALRLAPEGMAQQVDNLAARQIVNLAAERKIPIMVFIGNRGCIQIHTGEVTNLMDAGPWFNILDPEFNMHLNETKIASSWLVIKPSTDGLIHSLEVFDEAGEMIVQFFGKRKPGIPELEEWRILLNDYKKSN